MEPLLLTPQNFNSPQVLKSEDNFLLVYKPPRIHSAPGKGENLVDRIAAGFPEILKVKGHREGEGGLLHRLDYETHGLLLFARNQDFFEKLNAAQNRNELKKEYGALAVKHENKNPGFPPRAQNFSPENGREEKSFIIESFFRAYGVGRKQVRPVQGGLSGEGIWAETETENFTAKKNLYRTEIIESRIAGSQNGKDIFYFRLRISRGFRHQIRCHLAWAGYPVLNDPLYGSGGTGDLPGFLALRAEALSFTDPVSGEKKYFRLPEIKPEDISG